MDNKTAEEEAENILNRRLVRFYRDEIGIHLQPVVAMCLIVNRLESFLLAARKYRDLWSEADKKTLADIVPWAKRNTLARANSDLECAI